MNGILKNRDINKLFVRNTKDYFGSLGFEIIDGKIERKLANGHEVIYYEQIDSAINAKARLSYSACKRINEIEEVWQNYYTKINAVGSSFEKERISTLAFDAARIRDYKFGQSDRKWFNYNDRYEEDATVKGIDTLINKFIDNFEKYILTTFNRFAGVHEIDKLLNERFDTYFEAIHLTTGNGLIFKKIISAKIVNNPDFFNIIDWVKFKINTMEYQNEEEKSKYIEVLDELIK